MKITRQRCPCFIFYFLVLNYFVIGKSLDKGAESYKDFTKQQWLSHQPDATIVNINSTEFIINNNNNENKQVTGVQSDEEIMLMDGMQLDSANPKEKVPCQPMPREVLQRIMGAAFNPRYMSIDPPETETDSELDTSSKFNQKDQALPRKSSKKIGAFHVHEGFTQILYDEPLLEGRNFKIDEVTLNNDSKFLPELSPSLQPFRKMASVTQKAHPHRHHKHHINQNRNHKKPQWWSNHHPEDEINLYDFKSNDFEQREPPEDPLPAPSSPGPSKKEPQMTPAEKFIKSVRSKRSVKSGFPWSCESKIEWLDLGPNHFPRFLRSVVCTSKECWFGHFQCRPKAFTVKVLRRRKDSCDPDIKDTTGSIDQADALTDNMDEVHDANSYVPPEFREQWVFQERAVTFCCECAG